MSLPVNAELAMKLAKLSRQLWAAADNPPVLVIGGHVVIDPETGRAVIDRDKQIQAIERAVRMAAYAWAHCPVLFMTRAELRAEAERLKRELGDE